MDKKEIKEFKNKKNQIFLIFNSKAYKLNYYNIIHMCCYLKILIIFLRNKKKYFGPYCLLDC